MTIGFLINTCEPFYRGGYERRAWAFARELAGQGHDVRIYTSCPRDEIIEGVRFIRMAAPRPFFNRRGVRNGWNDVLFTLSLMKLLWKLKSRELDVMDVCATPFLHLPCLAAIVSMKSIPMVLTCHEALLASLSDYVRERGHRSAMAREGGATLLSAIYRGGMGLFPQRLAVSHRTNAALGREGYPAQAVVEFGLEPGVFALQLPTPLPGMEPVRFIFCGRLTSLKSVDQTVKALLSLRSESKPFHFDIAGDGSERSALERMVRETGAENLMTFHGEVSEEAKRALFARSEIFILSSPREGFSIATLEAMAQGCAAVVVSDSQKPNGALDFVRDHKEGLVIEPGLPAMRKALGDLLRQPELRLALRRKAWETAQTYRIETQTQRLLSFYRSV